MFILNTAAKLNEKYHQSNILKYFFAYSAFYPHSKGRNPLFIPRQPTATLGATNRGSSWHQPWHLAAPTATVAGGTPHRAFCHHAFMLQTSTKQYHSKHILTHNR